jgi:hypothetical protein
MRFVNTINDKFTHKNDLSQRIKAYNNDSHIYCHSIDNSVKNKNIERCVV